MLFLEGGRDGYSPEQCGRTMTVGELIAFLQDFDEEEEVYLRNDSGYTFGRITEECFEEEEEACPDCGEQECVCGEVEGCQ